MMGIGICELFPQLFHLQSTGAEKLADGGAVHQLRCRGSVEAGLGCVLVDAGEEQ